jgi:hypothetical protein
MSFYTMEPNSGNQHETSPLHQGLILPFSKWWRYALQPRCVDTFSVPRRMPALPPGPLPSGAEHILTAIVAWTTSHQGWHIYLNWAVCCYIVVPRDISGDPVMF